MVTGSLFPSLSPISRSNSRIGIFAFMAIVRLPVQLMKYASIPHDTVLQFEAESLSDLYDRLELAYPQLRGTLRDPSTKTRRAYIRIFAQREDLSDTDPNEMLSPELSTGAEIIHFVTAISGG